MSLSEPATPSQLYQIARYCLYAGISEELEQKPMTKLEARNLLYNLRKRSKVKGGQYGTMRSR